MHIQTEFDLSSRPDPVKRLKRWDTRHEDDKVFWQYSKNNSKGEYWVSLETAESLRQQLLAAAKRRSIKFRDALSLKNKEWRERNLEHHRRNSREYGKNNREKVNEYKRRYLKRKRDLDPVYRLSVSIRTRTSAVFREKKLSRKSKTGEILGCSWEELKAYIEKQFLIGMGWHNRSEWHIDHIIPMAHASTTEEVERLSHYTNLQPLWKIDNLKKGSKLAH